MIWVMVLGSLFAAIGGALLLAGGWQFTRRRAFVRQSTTTVGTIVAVTETREHDDISYFPKVRFRTPSGREVTFRSEIGRSWRAGRIGQTVAVRYRPDPPHGAEIDTFVALWGATLLFGGLGVAFLFVGLGILLGVLPV